MVATNTAGRVNGSDATLTTLLAPFPQSSYFPANSAVTFGSVDVADFDRDGNLDVAISGLANYGPAETVIYRNAGGGNFVDLNAGLPGLSFSSVAWGDYNNDGYPDLLICGNYTNGPATFLYKNNGNGTFSNILSAALPPVASGSVVWGDFDNDGRPDILLMGLTNGSVYMSCIARIFHNNGDGTFTDIHANLAGVGTGSAACADYNRDGWLDVLLTGQDNQGNPQTYLYRNNGNGTFTLVDAGFVGVAQSTAAWGDYNNDGWPDLVIAGATNYYGNVPVTILYRNNGDGTFTDIHAGLPGVFDTCAARWGDYDSDGKLDLLLTGSDTNYAGAVTKVFRNAGGDTFVDSNIQVYPAGGSSVGAWADFNNDGRLDLLLSGDNLGYYAMLYTNALPQTNSRPLAPTGLGYTNSGSNITFYWNPSSDPQTPGNGLSYNMSIAGFGSNFVSPDSIQSNGIRLVAKSGNAGSLNHWTITGLTNAYLTWSVQTIDTSFAGSPFASSSFVGYPPLLTNFTRLANGSVQFQFSDGVPGANLGYSVSVSTNLSTWSFLANPVSLGGGLYQFTDPSTDKARFYEVYGGHFSPP